MKTFDEKYNQRRYRTAYSTSVFSITMVLFMLGLVALMIFHTHKLSAWFRENIAVSIVIKDEVPDSEIHSFKLQLDTLNFVKSSKFISKNEAAEKLRSELGEDFVEFIGYNPLPSTLEVFLNEQYAFGDSLVNIESLLMQNEMVQKVEYQKLLIDLIDKNISNISTGILIFSGLLLIISIILIYNTIRLALYSKRLLIKSMLLVGATQQFIRKPFIVSGVFQGLIGGIISVILLGVTLIITKHKLPELDVLNDHLVLTIIGVLLIAFGVLLTWLSNYFAVKKYLKSKSEDLY